MASLGRTPAWINWEGGTSWTDSRQSRSGHSLWPRGASDSGHHRHDSWAKTTPRGLTNGLWCILGFWIECFSITYHKTH